jgi:hypothetical protein
MGIAFSGAATCFSCIFLFWGILSLALTDLSRSSRVLDPFTAISINYPSGTSIHTGILAARKWDIKFSYYQ